MSLHLRELYARKFMGTVDEVSHRIFKNTTPTRYQMKKSCVIRPLNVVVVVVVVTSTRPLRRNADAAPAAIVSGKARRVTSRIPTIHRR